MPQEVDAITKLYDYLLWMIPKLEKFPRSQKFVLADRIESLTLDILDLLIEAAYSRKKDDLLRRANLQLEKLRYLVRLAKDFKLINIKSYEHSARLMDGIGTLTSLALQYGVPLDALVRKFAHVRFEPSGFTKNPDIRNAASITD